MVRNQNRCSLSAGVVVLGVALAMRLGVAPVRAADTTAAQDTLASQTRALVTVAEAFGPRLAGLAWIPEGARLGDQLAQIPLGRFLQSIRVAGFLASTGRWLSGLPLPEDGWRRVMRGPTLLIWVRPVGYGQLEESGRATLPEKAEANIELTMLVSLDPGDPQAGRSIIQWMTRDGFALAQGKYSDLEERRRRVAGEMLHVWERKRPGETPSRQPILAYAQRDGLLVLAGDERIVSEVLAKRNPRPAEALPNRFVQEALRTIEDARREKAPLAGAFDVRAFPVLRSAQWLTDGLGIEQIGKAVNRLAQADARTSEALAKAQNGLQHLGDRAHQGGVNDLARLEILYWPDERLPRSRIRLVFDDQARTWMEEMAAGRPFRLAEYAPADCVAFWTLRVPQRLMGQTAERGGAEIGLISVPTKLRVAGVWAIEAPSLTTYLRTQKTKVDDFFETRTVELPVEIPLSGAWKHVKETMREVEPWMPLFGVRWKARLAGDYLMLSTSAEALNKVKAGGQAARTLRTTRPELFDAATTTPVNADLGPGRAAFERYSDLALHAQSVRALDIVQFPFLAEPSEDAKFFDINYLALAQKVPQVREWLSVLPPQHTRVTWYPRAATLELTTQSASGLPGDPRVWGAVGASLIPTFDVNVSGWSFSLDQLNPARWWSKPEEKKEK